MYIEVALPLPLLRTFYYRCPPALEEALQPGQRLLVPFQNRKLTGYLARKMAQLPADSPPAASIREIIALLDESSLVSDELLQLSRWVADYYYASLGEVLKACLPPKTNLETRRHVAISLEGLNALSDEALMEALPEPEKELLKRLAERGRVELKELGKTENATSLLRKLAARKFIQFDQLLSQPGVSEKLQWAALLQPGYADKLSEAKLTPLQQAAAGCLARASAPLLMSALEAETGAGAATLRALEKKGLVELKKIKVQRDPFRAFSGFAEPVRHAHTDEQRDAIRQIQQAIQTGTFAPMLLHGVTGSGKTEIYLVVIEQLLKEGKGSLLLMPEIGLTPRVAHEFRVRLGDKVAILHSALGEGERHDEWWRIKRGEVGVVIGTRSAVFAPLDHLKLIVVDEEHDPSYKQQESPRYQGRDTALMRGKMNQAVVLLGSATPSVESFYNARQGKYQYLRLANRVQSRPLPEVQLIDMREDFRESKKKSPLSAELENAIRARLEKKEQTLILLNRRGYSAAMLCRSCGETIPCKYCSIPLAYHKGQNRLLCHYCDYQLRLPKNCPHCGSEYLCCVGEGTEKIEGVLEKEFANARIARLDRDVAQRKNARIEILRQFQQRGIDILAGTQMIAKGHDFPHVTLAGILSADTSLSFPDFRAAERTFQLLSQMAGRPGRGELAGEVLIQTFYPEHYCLKFVKTHDYEGFYEKEIRFRRMMHYPPFTALALIHSGDRNPEAAAGRMRQLGKLLDRYASDQLRVLGPVPAPLQRLRSEHRFQIILKSSSRARLHEILRRCLREAEQQGLDATKIYVDIDPVNLM